jgi:uncharacterized protein YwqG
MAHLRRKIANHGLDQAAKYIVENAAECYAVMLDGPDKYTKVGNTRFGGDPDLPVGFQWPCDGDRDAPETRFSNFVAQINFAELPPLQGGSPLPRQGILYIFVKSMEGEAERVILDTLYFDGHPSSLTRVPSPDSERLQNEYLVDLRPQEIRAVPAVSLPNYRRDFRKAIQTLTEEDEVDVETRRIELLCDLQAKGQIGQILGFANAGDERENLYRQFYLARIGKRRLIYNDYWDSMQEYEADIEDWRQRGELGWVKGHEAMREGVTWLVDNREKIAKGVSEWLLLCQIESNREMDFWINDADPLYTFIRHEDLANRDFSCMAAEVTQA